MPYTDFHYTPTGTGVISGKEVLEQTEDAINDLGGQISGDVQTAIDTANNALNVANTASTDAQNAVNTANTAHTAATNAQNTANAAQTTASNALTAAQNAQNDVNALGNRVTTAENNISQNTSDISGLTTRMGTAEGNITNLQNDVITAQGSATSAQNTATLAREQAYVTRYTNTAVSDNSTVAYSDLNNTDNIKISDFILDVNGKLFAITAVDTANETVSVTTPLTQLALDGNVVHKSGNETKTGNLDLVGDLNIQNPDTTASTPQLNLRNTKVARASSSETGAQLLLFIDKNARALSGVETRVSSNTSTSMTFTAYNTDSNNQTVSDGVSVIKTSTATNFAPTTDNAVTCGRSVARWSGVYSTEYYYGANNTPFSDKFVTTDTAQTVSGSKTFSSNVNVYNSDNTANTPNIILKNSKAEVGTEFTEQSINFVDKNNNALAKIHCYGSSGAYTRLYIIAYDSNNNSDGVFIRKSLTGTAILPTTPTAIAIGNSTFPYYNVQSNRFNGLEPSSLSLPSQTYVDISSYFTNTGTGEYNTYTAPSNGWIFLQLGDISSCQAQVLDSSDNVLWGTSSSGGVEMITIPILSGCKLQTQWATGSAVTVATARFIPCQGNV